MSDKPVLYQHTKHEHIPRNPTVVHKQEQQEAGFNQRVAIGITKLLSSMITFWIVGLFITLWILAQFTPEAFDKLPFPLLLTILNIPQISMMIGLGVGQGVLGRKQEIQADEMYQFTIKSYHDLEQVMLHLDAQDGQILEMVKMIALLKLQSEARLRKRRIPTELPAS